MSLADLETKIKQLEEKNSSPESDDDEVSIKAKKLPKQNKKRKYEQLSEPFICDLCENVICRTKDEVKRHKRDLIHRQRVVLAAGAAYQPHRNTPLFCKACQVQLPTEEEFHLHKKTEEHKIKLEEDRDRSYCKICKKQFNSAFQLGEHCKGKLHIQYVSKKKTQWKRSKDKKRNLR